MAGGCANCGARLDGAYCSACGQRVEPRIQPLAYFVGEAFDTITNIDSRMWRTLLPLLGRPGWLTQEYLQGRRASYVPPFKLYFVIALFFFLLAASLAITDSGPLQIVTAADVKTGPGDSADRCRFEAADWIEPRLEAACRRVIADRGRGLGAKFMENMPNAMFVFLPFLAVVMQAMYRRPRRYYVEHLLFLIHNQAFAFLFFALCLLVSFVVPQGARGVFGLIAFAYLCWYFFRSMRRVYAEGRARTLAKFTLLGFMYVISGAIMVLLTAFVSAISL